MTAVESVDHVMLGSPISFVKGRGHHVVDGLEFVVCQIHLVGSQLHRKSARDCNGASGLNRPEPTRCRLKRICGHDKVVQT